MGAAGGRAPGGAGRARGCALARVAGAAGGGGAGSAAAGAQRAFSAPGARLDLCRLPIKWEPEVIGGSRGCDASRAAAAAARTLRAGFNGQLPPCRPPVCPLPRFRSEDEMDIYSTGVRVRNRLRGYPEGAPVRVWTPAGLSTRGAQGIHTPSVFSSSVIEIPPGAAQRGHQEAAKKRPGGGCVWGEPSQAHSFALPTFPHLLPCAIPTGWGARVTRGCCLEFIRNVASERPALREPGEGAREGKGGCLWEHGFFQGSRAGLPRSPRFPPSLGFGKKREGAKCVPPRTWTWVPSVYACLWRCNRRDFSGCRLRCIYPNTSSSQASCRKWLRLVCTPTPRPYAGLEVAPSARAAESPASKGGWTSGAPRLSGLKLLGSAWQPPPLLVLRKPAPPGSPAVKTESKYSYRGSPNFDEGSLLRLYLGEPPGSAS
ncbi:uncharacterized protein LOC116535320 [Sapajus apella]|uniref:Uncharacterized protein LOC116535320 n=1 Tax=Sapajus apella TaxID=9515 RepID=A0A6J3G1S5_SAPAP|nr:uncharacterized protein LOC116535320 [Sapajus apella]